MTGLGLTGTGSAGSSFNSETRETASFPAVPYNASHFTPRSMCPSADGMSLFFYKINFHNLLLVFSGKQ
jgi:hypothetical protein